VFWQWLRSPADLEVERCNRRATTRVFNHVSQVLAPNEPLRELALAGDERAFEALIGPLVEPALRLAHSMLGDRDEAEDATQEAVIRAWRKLGQLRPGMPVRPWFLAIVGNQCRNLRRTRWFRLVRTVDTWPDQARPEPVVDRLDLERSLARLPRRDRQALFLRFYLDLPLDEVALALGLSPAAAKARIYRACHRLRPGLVMEDI
jgi:RNA polymerase sigma-70 factor, ECF subfamily